MKFLEELKKLNLPKDKYAIFGSGVLAAHGIRENKDLDIIAKKDLFKELSKKYELNEKGAVKIGEIEIFIYWPPFKELDSLIDDAEIINGIRFVKLDKVVEWKKYRNNEKDQNDIKLINKFIKG
ncbi:MAG: hypothetical protein WC413_03835 [Candidatus Nanoarchaeia archaeon]